MNYYRAQQTQTQIDIFNTSGDVVISAPSKNPLNPTKVMWYVVHGELYFIPVDISVSILPMWNKAMSTLQHAIRNWHDGAPLERYGFGTLNYSYYSDKQACTVNIGTDPVLQIELDDNYNFSRVRGIPISHRQLALENTPIYQLVQSEVSEIAHKRTLN